MSLAPEQIAAGQKVHATLKAMERAVRKHHLALAELRDAFQGELSSDDYQTFGGGTNKNTDPDGP